MKKMFFKILILLFAGAPLSLAPGYAIEEITLDESEEYKKGVKFEMSLNKPKKVVFKNALINEFSPVLNFRGEYTADIKEDRSNFTYPFSIEGGGELKFDGGKNKIRAVSKFTRDTDDFNNKFLGKLSDVYFERKIKDNHRVLIGNSRIPIGLEGGKSSYSLMFAKRAQIASRFGNARALGARFRGDFGAFDYDFGGYSSTRYLQDITDGAEFAGSVNYKPFYDDETSLFKDFKVGASVNTGVRGSGYTVLNTGMEWKYKKFLLNAEFAYADGSNASKYNSNEQDGFYVTAAYDITDKIQAAARYDVLDTNVNKPDDTIQKYTLGLNYYVIGQRLRFSVDYTYTQNGGAINSSNSSAVHFMTQVMI